MIACANNTSRHRYGLDLVVYNPVSSSLHPQISLEQLTDHPEQKQLAGGVFSGKYKSKSEIPSEGRFANTSERTGKVCTHNNLLLSNLPIE